MLGEPTLETLMRFHLKTQGTYGTAPFKYLSNQDKMIVSKNFGSPKESFKLTLCGLIVVGLFLQIYYQDINSVEVVQRFESLFYASAIALICIAKWGIFIHGSDVVELYNLFVAFEKSCLKGQN